MGARGNSGVILSQILRGLASTLKHGAEASGRKVAEALAAASVGAYQAVLRPIEGTILTVVRESAEGAKAASAEGASLVEVLRAARAAGKEALDRTPELLPVLEDAGVVDAGGAGYLLLLDSALHVVDGSPLPEPDEGDGPTAEQLEAVSHRHADTDGGLDVSEQRYEVMYFLDLDDERIDDLQGRGGARSATRSWWSAATGSGTATSTPTTSVPRSRSRSTLDGRPQQIRVTDLFEEMARRARPSEASPRPARRGLPPVTTAVVAVCSRRRARRAVLQPARAGIVTGGQTLNPSTAELLDTVEHVNADQVVILPNNKNIIPVAEQVDALTSKTVVVVPTRTMPEALAALVVYDPEAPAAENAAEMGEAIESVATGEVTQAVRDSNSDAGPIKSGDWIGIVRGDGIVAVAASPVEASVALLDRLITTDRELLTIITGSGADPATTAEIEDWIAEHRARRPGRDPQRWSTAVPVPVRRRVARLA